MKKTIFLAALVLNTGMITVSSAGIHISSNENKCDPVNCSIEVSNLLDDLQMQSLEVLNILPAVNLSSSVLEHMATVTLLHDRKMQDIKCSKTCHSTCKKVS